MRSTSTERLLSRDLCEIRCRKRARPNKGPKPGEARTPAPFLPETTKDPADEQTIADEQGARASHDREGIAAAVVGTTFATPARFVASLSQAYILLTF